MVAENIKAVADPRNLASTAKSLMSGNGSRIGNGIAIALLLLAAIADLLSLIPFVGDAVGPIFWVGFSIFLYLKGCGFLNTRRLAVEAISFIAELVPAIQALPTIIAGTLAIIFFIRLEDKTGISIVKPLSKGSRGPLNQAGMRMPQRSQESPESDDGPNYSRNPNTQPLNVDGIRQPNS